jgi:hypothetical protein
MRLLTLQRPRFNLHIADAALLKQYKMICELVEHSRSKKHCIEGRIL